MVKPLSRKRQRTRAALVDATLALIAEHGLAGVTLDAVAARAGVTKGAIYSNYRNKGAAVGRGGHPPPAPAPADDRRAPRPGARNGPRVHGPAAPGRARGELLRRAAELHPHR